MRAMIMTDITDIRKNPDPLVLADLPIPEPGPGEIRIRVCTCGVCHTELDELEGRTPPPDLPMVLGHQVVGRVDKTGPGAGIHARDDRVGVAWIFSACGNCKFCNTERENLCDAFRATGRDANGGYAEYMTVPEDFAIPIPDLFTDIQAAPLLCAGAIGYRSMKLTGLTNGDILGLTGFGASAHLVLKMVRHTLPDTAVFVFTRSPGEQVFARELGASWAGGTEERSPKKCDAIIDTTPAWKPVVEALANLEKGGRLVINAIRKEAADQEYLHRLDYPAHLWLEKEIKSVANVTRADVTEFLSLAADIPIIPNVQEYALEDANRALHELRTRKIKGAKVLRIS